MRRNLFRERDTFDAGAFGLSLMIAVLLTALAVGWYDISLRDILAAGPRGWYVLVFGSGIGGLLPFYWAIKAIRRYRARRSDIFS